MEASMEREEDVGMLEVGEAGMQGGSEDDEDTGVLRELGIPHAFDIRKHTVRKLVYVWSVKSAGIFLCFF